MAIRSEQEQETNISSREFLKQAEFINVDSLLKKEDDPSAGSGTVDEGGGSSTGSETGGGSGGSGIIPTPTDPEDDQPA